MSELSSVCFADCASVFHGVFLFQLEMRWDALFCIRAVSGIGLAAFVPVRNDGVHRLLGKQSSIGGHGLSIYHLFDIEHEFRSGSGARQRNYAGGWCFRSLGNSIS